MITLRELDLLIMRRDLFMLEFVYGVVLCRNLQVSPNIFNYTRMLRNLQSPLRNVSVAGIVLVSCVFLYLCVVLQIKRVVVKNWDDVERHPPRHN